MRIENLCDVACLVFHYGFIIGTAWASGLMFSEARYEAAALFVAFGFLYALRSDLNRPRLHRLADTVSLSAESCGLGPESLERENFRIDSTGWNEKALEDGARVKANPQGDVTEILEGEFAGEQHFTLVAALRETAKAGKRMPTEEEWRELIKAVNPSIDPERGWQQDVSVRETLGLKLAGSRGISSDVCSAQGAFGYYWASSTPGTYGYHVGLSSTHVFPANNDGRTYGFSVRCLKD